MTLTTKIKLAAALTALAVMFSGGFYLAGLRAEVLQKSQQLETSRRETAGLALELEAGRRALAAREAEQERLAADLESLKAKLEEIYEADPNSRAWADAHCPDDVLECLR